MKQNYILIEVFDCVFLTGFGLDDRLDDEDAYGQDDKLTPLQKLEKYMQSDNVYTR